MADRGAVAERLGRGLQSLVQRFESARRLLVVPGPATRGYGRYCWSMSFTVSMSVVIQIPESKGSYSFNPGTF